MQNVHGEDLAMRSASFVAALMFSAFLTGLLASSSSAEAKGGNCQGKLADKSYNCVYDNSNGGSGTFCMDFITGGFSTHFDMFENGLDYGCTCGASGSLKSPKFDASSSAWECVDAFGDQYGGKVNSNKLSGQSTDNASDSLLFSCTERSSSTCP